MVGTRSFPFGARPIFRCNSLVSGSVAHHLKAITTIAFFGGIEWDFEGESPKLRIRCSSFHGSSIPLPQIHSVYLEVAYVGYVLKILCIT